jgi:hypothetical protein
MQYTKIVVALMGILSLALGQEADLSCTSSTVSAGGMCDVGKYCAYTLDNNDCTTKWADQTEPVLLECAVDGDCSARKCVNGLCCLSKDPSKCPSAVIELQRCCFKRHLIDGGAEWRPVGVRRPIDLNCGCPSQEP